MRSFPNSGWDNAGLALARCAPWKANGEKDAAQRAAFFKQVEETPADSVYFSAFSRWERAMTARKALVATATLGGPLAVGLGNESPYEVGLTLHRIYGMPLIPGSAVKGACRRALDHRFEKETRERIILNLFGDTSEGGGAVFHDAWFVPGSVDQPLAVDTVTVHHPQYYEKKGDGVWPTDFDDPRPVPFISVRPGARFLFAVEVASPDPTWLVFVEEMLRHTLTKIGLGGKTNAGYGWFSEFKPAERPKSPEQLLEPYRGRIAALTPQSLSLAPTMLASAEPDVRSLLAEALKQHIRVKMRRWSEGPDRKSWQKPSRRS